MSGRVLMVSASFHPYVGGSEKQALELSVALQRLGWRVKVLTRQRPGLPGRDVVRGVEVERLWAPWSGPLNSIAFMASLFVRLLSEARSAEAIHVHLAGSPALPAVLAGRLLGKPVILKLGGGRGIGELAASAATFLGRLKIRLLRWLDPRFVAVTKDLAKELSAYGLSGSRLIVCPNGVDTSVYRPVSADEKAALRQAWGWPPGLGFLYVGRLIPEKRLLAFLDAWNRQSRESGAPTFAAFVGEGPEESALRAWAAGRSDRVFFHRATAEPWKAYQAADVFVLPSVSEGLSNALLEAMACGLAVLGSRVGGTAEAVRDGAAGLLFDDAAGLERAVGRLLASPSLAATLGAAGRESAVTYSIGDVARRYAQLYGRIDG